MWNWIWVLHFPHVLVIVTDPGWRAGWRNKRAETSEKDCTLSMWLDWRKPNRFVDWQFIATVRLAGLQSVQDAMFPRAAMWSSSWVQRFLGAKLRGPYTGQHPRNFTMMPRHLESCKRPSAQNKQRSWQNPFSWIFYLQLQSWMEAFSNWSAKVPPRSLNLSLKRMCTSETLWHRHRSGSWSWSKMHRTAVKCESLHGASYAENGLVTSSHIFLIHRREGSCTCDYTRTVKVKYFDMS